MRAQLRPVLLALVLALILAAIFMAYLRPGFVVDLANRMILCF